MPTTPLATAPVPPQTPRRRRGRAWFIVLAVLLGLLACVALAVRFGPQWVAREVVRTYLGGLNIDTSGVETLRIRLLQGYFSFGPVTFRGGTAGAAGQVGRIGVKIDVARLLHRQALVEAIAIEGVRFEVRQAADGAFSLNGIPLSELLADRAAGKPTRPPGSPAEGPARPFTPQTLQEELGWGAGLDSLRILDSQVVFIDARGGEAVMYVRQLDLGGFRTWAPDTPGHYQLDAELNDIGLAASGIAKPFADKVQLEADAEVSGIEVTKIERYLGPLGFTSQAGQIDLAIHGANVVLFAAGHIDGSLAATGSLTGVDLAHPLFGRGQLATGSLRLDNVVGSYDAPGEGNLAGDLGIDLQASELHLQNGTEVGFSHVALGLPGTTVRIRPEQQPAVRVAPQLDVADLKLGGPVIRGSIDKTAVRLTGFSMEGTEPGSPFQASGSVAIERVALQVPDPSQPVAIAADRLQVDLAETWLAFPPGRGPRVAGGLSLDTRQLSVTAQPPPPAPAARGRGVREPASLPASRLQAARLAFAMPSLQVDDDGGAGAMLTARDSALSFDDVRLGGPAVQGTVGHAAFRLASLSMNGRDLGAPMVATGSVAVDRVDVLLPDAEPVTLAAAELRADLAETRLALAPGGPRVQGGLAVETRDLLVTLQELGRNGGPKPPPTRIEAGRFKADLPKLAFQEGANGGSQSLRADRPLLTLDDLRLGGADIQGTVGGAVIRLDRTDVLTAEHGTPVVATGTVEAQRLDLVVPDVEPIDIVADRFDARLVGTRFAFPAGQSLIEGAVGVDSRELTLRIHQLASDGGPPLPPLLIRARRFAGQVPTLKVEDARTTGTKVNVGTPMLALERFRMDAPVDRKSNAQLAASTMILQRIDINVIDAKGGSEGRRLDVAGQANLVAPDLAVTIVPADGKAGGKADGAAKDAAAPPPGPNAQIRRLGLDLPRFGYRKVGEVNGFGMQGRIDLGSLKAELPAAGPGDAPDRIGLTNLGLDISDVDAAIPKGRPPEWTARLDLDLGSASAALPAPVGIDGQVDGVSLRRFAGGSNGEYGFDALTVRSFDAVVRRQASGPEEHKEPATREETRHWPPDDLPTIRIGRVGLIEGGRVTLRDRSVAPPVDASLDLDRFDLENLDTKNADARTTLQVLGRLAGSPVSVNGWANAFRARPSLDLQARIDDLGLSTFSPYFGPAIGLDVLSGSLTLDATGEVTDGLLDGTVRARIVGVRVADRPGGPADDAQADPRADLRADPGADLPPLGPPLSTLIRLIENRQGAIDVALPVRGDLLSPEFGYRRVVWNLLPQVLWAFVSSPVSFVSSARSVLAAQRARSEAASASAGASPRVTPGATAGTTAVAAGP